MVGFTLTLWVVPLLTSIALVLYIIRRSRLGFSHLHTAESFTHCFWFWERQTNLIQLSRYGHLLFGLCHDNPLSLNCLLQLIHPDDRDGAAANFDRMQQQGSGCSFFVRVKDKSARWCWLLCRGQIEQHIQGEVVGIRGIFVEVDEENIANLASAHSMQAIIHANRISTMAVVALSIIHELNQPLSAILSNAQAAVRILAAAGNSALLSDVPELTEIVQDIVQDNRRASSLLAAFRKQIKQKQVMVEPVLLLVEVQASLTLLKNEALARDVGVELSVPEVKLIVMADQIQLQQVLVNLLLNAFDALSLIPRPRKAELSVTFDPNSAEATVQIKDCGPGLCPQVMAQLFQPCFSPKTQGLGVGLFICRSIIEAHYGTIAAGNNTDGPGATFCFTLPAKVAE